MDLIENINKYTFQERGYIGKITWHKCWPWVWSHRVVNIAGLNAKFVENFSISTGVGKAIYSRRLTGHNGKLKWLWEKIIEYSRNILNILSLHMNSGNGTYFYATQLKLIQQRVVSCAKLVGFSSTD